MNVSVVVQTCDEYEKYWDGFFYYMDKFWDFKIDCPLYFCTETKNISNKNYINIKTGKNTFVNNLNFILEKIETDYIFYLLEDFWPINNLKKDLFENIFNYILLKNIKAFQVSPYVPYYKLEKTKDKIKNQHIYKFSKNSDWRFNFQSRYWEKTTLKESIANPEISENILKSCIGTEIASSKKLNKNIDVYFYHYFWYPMSGVSYRGSFTSFGLELKNNMMIDLYGKNY